MARLSFVLALWWSCSGVAGPIEHFLGQLESPRLEDRSRALAGLSELGDVPPIVLARIMEKVYRPSAILRLHSPDAESWREKLSFNRDAIEVLVKFGRGNAEVGRFLFRYALELEVERASRASFFDDDKDWRNLSTGVAFALRHVEGEAGEVVTRALFDRELRGFLRSAEKFEQQEAILFAFAAGVHDDGVDAALAAHLRRHGHRVSSRLVEHRNAVAGPAAIEAILEILNEPALRRSLDRTNLRVLFHEDQKDRCGAIVAAVSSNLPFQLIALAKLAASHSTDPRLLASVESLHALIPNYAGLDEVLRTLRR